MRLEYEIQATGLGQLKRVMRSVEQEQRSSAVRSANNYTRIWARQLAQLKRQMMAAQARGAGPRGALPARGESTAGTTTAMVVEKRTQSMRLQHIDQEGHKRIRMIKDTERIVQAGVRTTHRIKLRNIEREKAREIAAEAKKRVERTAFRGTMARAGLRGLGAGVGTVGRVGGGILALGGGFAATNAIQGQMALSAQASTLANQAGMPARKAEIAAVVQNVRGVAPEEAMRSLEQWQGLTGDLAAGMEILPQLAKVSIATGTDMADMTAMAGNALNALAVDIQDPTERLKALNDVMRTISAQGAVGAVEVANLATEMAGMAASAGQFAGGSAQSIKVMGAMAQMARRLGGASSAAEAITSLERFTTDLTSKSKALKNLGVDIWTPKGQGPKRIRAQQDVIVEILQKTQADPEKLGKIFGQYGIRAIRGYGQVYREAEARQKGTGAEAVRREFAGMLDIQTGEGVIQQRYQSRLEDADVRLMEVSKRFNEEIGTRLLPVLTELIPVFEKLIPTAADLATGFGKVASWTIENPFKAAGAVIAAKAAQSMAEAAIGEVVKKAIEGQISTAGKAGLVFSVAAATFMFGKSLIDFIFDAQGAGQSQAAVEGAQRGAEIAKAEVTMQRETRAARERGETVPPPMPAKTRDALVQTALATTQDIKATSDVATQGFWDTLKNTLLGTGPGFGEVREAQAKQAAGQEGAMQDVARIQELLAPVIDAQLKAAAAAQDAAQAQRASSMAPDAPKRNSPVLNRGT